MVKPRHLAEERRRRSVKTIPSNRKKRTRGYLWINSSGFYPFIFSGNCQGDGVGGGVDVVLVVLPLP